MSLQLPKSVYVKTKGRKNPYVEFLWEDGTRKGKTVKASIEVVERQVQIIRDQIALGTFDVSAFIPTVQSNVSLGFFRRVYLDFREGEVKRGERSPNSLQADKYALRMLIELFGETRGIHTFNSDLLKREFIDKLISKETHYGEVYKPRSINNYLKHLKSAFSWAKERGYIKENPFWDLKPLKVDRIKRYPSESEIEQFRKYYANGPQWKLDAFNLALWTGCRLSSIIELKKDSLYIIRHHDKEQAILTLVEKGNKRREIPLLSEPLALIERRILALSDVEKQKPELARLRTAHRIGIAQRRIEEGCLFWEVANRATISKAFTNARRDLGIDDPNLTFHTLRKAFGTYGLEQGLSLETVQYILGHSSIRITEDIYTEITLRKVSEEMAGIRAK